MRTCNKQKTIGYGAGLLVLVSQTALGVEPLSQSDLASYCSLADKHQAVARERCQLYVQGFIDGAVATDDRVIQNLDKEYSESFVERALRVRGRGTASGENYSRYGSTSYADFCLDPEVPIEQVTDKVVATALQRDLDSASSNGRDFVYAVLRKHYPCPKITKK